MQGFQMQGFQMQGFQMNVLRALISAAGVCAALILIIASALEAAAQTEPNTSKACPPVPSGWHERYRLPPPSKAPGGVSFATDWTQNRTGGWAGEQVMDRCRFQPDGFQTWHGKPAVRVEVQPHDDPLALRVNSERAEMLRMQDAGGRPLMESSSSGVQYYATSYYFPTTWKGQQLPWRAFAPADCAAGAQTQCNSWSVIWQFYPWGGLSAAQTAPDGPQHYRFFGAPFADNGLLALGKWTDFVFRVDWATGDYTIWRRDEGQTAFTRAVTGKSAVPAREVYVKQGLYRGGNVDGRIDVMWIGPTVRGPSFAAVEREAFGTGSGQP
jgi:hypothetical protein